MNAALIGVLVVAIVYVTVDGAIKIRAMHQRANRPVSPQRMQRLTVVKDPLLEMEDNQPTVVVLDFGQLFRGES